MREEYYGERDPLMKAALETNDKFQENLLYARIYLKSNLGIEDLTNKELLLLSSYVRKIFEEEQKAESDDIEIPKESSYRWFTHVTGFNVWDFKRKDGVFRPEDRAYIKLLRNKYNSNDN